jgi:hypothetical protein
LENIKFLSVMTPAQASGSTTFNIQTFNASPNLSITFAVTGISTGMSEEAIATTICYQTSAVLAANDATFKGILTPIDYPIAPNFGTAFTDHVVSLMAQAQYSWSIVSDTTGCEYYLDTTPVFCTVDEALAFGPLNSQLLQNCASSGQLDNTQISELLAMASSDMIGILNNNIVSCNYVYYFSTLMTNALKFPNAPVQYFWNPYALRPTIIALASQVATFNLASNYNVDFTTGWITFRFAQDLLFNYEPFDYQNQWYVGYIAGYNQIPREVKSAVLRWSYVIQAYGFMNIEEISDGVSKIKYSVDKNIEKRNIFSTLRKYMQ